MGSGTDIRFYETSNVGELSRCVGSETSKGLVAASGSVDEARQSVLVGA